MQDLVVIIPLHEYNKKVEELLNRAVSSVPQKIEIRISCAYGIGKKLEKTFADNDDIVIVENPSKDSKTDFCSLVNNAVGDSKWFSILEYDDRYTSIWFDNFRKYYDFHSDVSVFMPLEDLMEYDTNEFIGMGNEAPHASSFSNELGFIDNDCLQQFFDFYPTGSIFNTEDWKELGGLKPSIKLSFWYEFLLRATHKGKKIYVIPKVGYTHYLGRKDSLMEKYGKEIDSKESDWWINLAKKEQFFTSERDPEKYVYNPEKVEDEE